MNPLPPNLLDTLRQYRQEHVLTGWETLTPAEQASLVQQLQGIDFAELQRLYESRELAGDRLDLSAITPLPVLPAGSATADDVARGREALVRGEVAALVVAGGQGSRLGFDKPKGTFPLAPLSAASLFQIHAEKLLALSRKFGRPIPFLVMTSPATDAETQAFFQENQFFGLDRTQVYFFQQGTMPALDLASGRLLLEKPGALFLSPNGHGGTIRALAQTGLLERLRQQGVRHLFYFQVDNPLVQVCDPAFLGQHLSAQADVSSKVVYKERPEEKVGVLALVRGRPAILEYSDLPEELTTARDASGELLLRSGNPAIHIFTLDFLQRLAKKDYGLTFHVARKKVPYYDPSTGQTVRPTQENALKFELFIFDALPLAERSLAVQTPREEEFAPVKNAEGPDSPAAARSAMVNRAARWLESAGVSVPKTSDGSPAFAIEISPLFAFDAEDLRAKLPAGFQLTGPTLLRG